jgi:hypothetical protein
MRSASFGCASNSLEPEIALQRAAAPLNFLWIRQRRVSHRRPSANEDASQVKAALRPTPIASRSAPRPCHRQRYEPPQPRSSPDTNSSIRGAR